MEFTGFETYRGFVFDTCLTHNEGTDVEVAFWIMMPDEVAVFPKSTGYGRCENRFPTIEEGIKAARQAAHSWIDGMIDSPPSTPDQSDGMTSA